MVERYGPVADANSPNGSWVIKDVVSTQQLRQVPTQKGEAQEGLAECSPIPCVYI